MEKVALVTGSSSGIGLETVLALARDGYETYASMRDVKKSAELEKASQLTEDLSKKLLTSENINREARKEIESLINYVKNN